MNDKRKLFTQIRADIADHLPSADLYAKWGKPLMDEYDEWFARKMRAAAGRVRKLSIDRDAKQKKINELSHELIYQIFAPALSHAAAQKQQKDS